MADVTTRFGRDCASGNHVEVQTLIDGVVVPELTVHPLKTDLQKGVEKPSPEATLEHRLNEAGAARDRMLLGTTAPDFDSYKLAVEAKVERIPDAKIVPPVSVEPGAIDDVAVKASSAEVK